MATYTKETALFDTGRISDALNGKQPVGDYAENDYLDRVEASLNDRITSNTQDISSINANMLNYAKRSDMQLLQQYLEEYIGVNGAIYLDGQALVIRTKDNRYSVSITPKGLFFGQDGNSVAHLTGNSLFITNAEITTNLIIGNFAFVPRDGRFTLKRIKGDE